ncbi:MAG: hypothetical protein ACK5P7_10965 [Bdellovibrio sp.]
MAERKDLHEIDLPISVLVELSRLDESKLKEFLKSKPVDELREVSFAKVKKLIRGENTNKRERSSNQDDKKEESPQQIAESLKITFEIVRDKFDEDAMDKDIDSVLGDISLWYLGKKNAA